jgi:hypothetical protein
MDWIKFGIPCLFLMYSCTKSETEILDPSTFGYEYYPLDIGKSWTYQMDSIVYSERVFVKKDSSISYIREEVVDSFRNVENNLVYSLNVFYTRDTNASWELISAFFVEKNESQLIKTENGLEFIKLIFPIRKNKSWEGNIRINSKTDIQIGNERLQPFGDIWYYNYQYFDKAEQTGRFVVDSVCKVMEADYDGFLEKRYSYAQYAKGVGLVYKELWLLDTQNTDDSIPFENRANKGMILRQTLVSYH